MTVRIVRIVLMLLVGVGLSPTTHAGVYSTIDNEVETQRMSHDYEKVFQSVLVDLRTIGLPAPKRETAIWKRYVLMETLGRKGAADLRTLEQTLNYSAVLIRRDKGAEAVQLLLPLKSEHRKNFVVLSQYALACFLSKSDDFRSRSSEAMEEAISVWPVAMNDLDEEQKKFLNAVGWHETDFHRNREYDAYLLRLMKHRVREEARLKKKLKTEEVLDPIFLDDKKQPVRFTAEAGEFAVGRIEFQKLPDNSVEIVEQLLIWMPHDQRLLWLLGEVLNARAMKFPKREQKDPLIRSSYAVFAELNNPLSLASYGRPQIKKNFEVLGEYVKTIPTERLDIRLPGETPPTALSTEQWQRMVIVGFITGFAVGMFALWQFQELRRRRQARHA